MLRHEGFGGVSDYMPVSAGQYTVAMRPVGAPASSPPSVSTSFMVAAGSNYTVASIGSASARRLEVLQDPWPRGRVESARPGHPGIGEAAPVTVSVGSDSVARDLAFGSASGTTPSSRVRRPSRSARRADTPPCPSPWSPVRSTPSSSWTGPRALTIDNVTDEVGSYDAPRGGAATGLGGTAPGGGGPGLAPWLATVAGGLLLATAGAFGLRRSRRTAPVLHD